ncbi:unnamed protein product [Callosobruchus maculatus]|uniref:Clip domain-containing protein n=1 Tax=Callosobruchus maculatus TaxID=64391 RepID=A0A653CRI4_CALMS|nr:unnamed protein product [Callosobruchus maculatus]
MFECISQLFCFCFVVVLFDAVLEGHAGICKLLEDCPDARKKIESGQFPEICGFIGTQSIVCCEGKAVPKDKEKDKEGHPTKKITGTKCQEKCREYSQYAYEIKESPTLSADSHISKTLECTFERQPLIVGGTDASRREFPHMEIFV